MRYIFIIALWCCSISLRGQSLKEQGTSVEEIVPEGWTHKETTGDLNKDGIKDLVVLTKPNTEENMFTRDDGYVYNFNPFILAIYFGQEDGQYRQYKQYDGLFAADDDSHSTEVEINITERGALNIIPSIFSSMGSYGTGRTTYTYRYQQGDFRLIGKESTELMRNSGEMTTISENYITWKRQTIVENAFEEGPRKETWAKLTKRPLEKLGDHEL